MTQVLAVQQAVHDLQQPAGLLPDAVHRAGARPAASPHAARSPAAAAIEGREEALEDGRLQGLKRDAMNLASQGATSHTGKPTELV